MLSRLDLQLLVLSRTHLVLDILEVRLELVGFSHGPIQTFVRLCIHVAYDTLHANVSPGVHMRMDLDSGVPVLLVIVVLACGFIVLQAYILVIMTVQLFDSDLYSTYP